MPGEIRILSDAPALVGRMSDTMERSTVSDLEISTSTIFPLPAVPQTLGPISLSAAAPARSSCAGNRFQDVINAPALVEEFFFSKGLWRMKMRGDWATLVNIVQVGYRIEVVAPGGTFTLLTLNDAGPVRFWWIDEWLSFDRDNFSIRTTVTAMGVGQQHTASFNIHAEKYL